MLLTCLVQVRLEVKVRPTSFRRDDSCRTQPAKRIGGCGFLMGPAKSLSVSGLTTFSRRNSVTSLLRDMVSSSVFVWLYLTIHFSAQDWIASRSRFYDSATSLRSALLSTIDHSVLSSAKTSRWLLTWLKKSLMKTRKSRGPSTLP